MNSLDGQELRKVERELDRYDSEESLRKFVERGWPILHPAEDERFVGGYCLDAICDHLQAVSDGYIRKLLINVPPGCTKSMTTAVYWPAWEWGPRKQPERKYIDAAYADTLTIRDNRRFRNLITSDWYLSMWGDGFDLAGDQNEKKKVENNCTGWKQATSVGGTATGERGNVFIIDDPHNVKDSESDAKRESAIFWQDEVVPTRMVNYKTGVIILIMQRIHERDCSGNALAKDLGYEHLMLPMQYEPDRKCVIDVTHPKTGKKFHFEDWRTEPEELLWPERMPIEVVDELKKQMTQYATAAQFQQRPAPRGGGMISRKDLKVVDEVPVDAEAVRGWDIAATASQTAAYTAGVKISCDSEGFFYVEDAVRFQIEESDKAIKALASQDGYDVEISIPQDPGAAGKTYSAYTIRQLAGYDVTRSPETGDKITRLKPFAAQCEAGNVRLVRGDWNEEYLAELTVFPYSATKDFADATSRAFAKLSAKPVFDASIIGKPEEVT